MPRLSLGSKSSARESFIRNVRLLDLDEEFDWPHITADTFAATSGVQNQQSRQYAAQWLLYKLFQLWDPNWTRESLRDLFPPLEPKQGMELRLRIYRQLAILKKEDVLAHDIAVRRTIFDDCKGPKFEELLASFSAVVLQRIVCQSEEDYSLVKQLAGGRIRLDMDFRVPLTLAYESGFHRILSERKAKVQRWRGLGAMMAAKESELHSTAAALEAQESSRRDKRILKRNLDRLCQILESHWVGDQEWIDILIQSDKHRPRATFLERSFGTIWSHTCNDTLDSVRAKENPSLLEELQSRVDKQNERLNRWRSVRDDLLIRSEEIGLHDSDVAYETSAIPIQSQKSYTGPISNRPDADHSTWSEDGSDMGAGEKSTTSIYEYQFQSYNDSPEPSKMNSETTGLTFTDATPRKPHDRSHLASPSSYSSERPAASSPTGEIADQILAKIAKTAPTPSRATLSLAERTRLSMARIGTPRQAPLAAENPAAASVQPPTMPELDMTPVNLQTDRFASLAERTRQSMSHATIGQQSKGNRKSRVSRLSGVNLYPVNQFQTPKKSVQGHFNSPDASILEERLDALIVDEESAFQSRPLVAQSPQLEPQPSAIEEDAEVSDDQSYYM